MTMPSNPALKALSPHLHDEDPLAGGEIAPVLDQGPTMLDFLERWHAQYGAPVSATGSPEPAEPEEEEPTQARHEPGARQWPALFAAGGGGDASPGTEPSATDPAAGDPSADMQDEPVPPFFMKSVPERDIERLRTAAKASGEDFEEMRRTYMAQRRRLILEIRRRADAVAHDIATHPRPFFSRRRPDPGDPYHGIKLAVLLMPADEAQNDRVQQLLLRWTYNGAETMDGGRLGFQEEKVTVQKGSPQAVSLLIAEAKARGWQSIEATGTKEFCTMLAQQAKQEGIELTAYVRWPSLAPPIRVVPGGVTPDAEASEKLSDPEEGRQDSPWAQANDEGAVREGPDETSEGTVREAGVGLEELEDALAERQDPAPAP